MAAARYVLVPSDDPEPRALPGIQRLRRFRLARVAPAPRAALGYDRHERLERVAEAERRLGARANGSR